MDVLVSLRKVGNFECFSVVLTVLTMDTYMRSNI